MSSLTRVYIHLTFHTRDNRPWMTIERESEVLIVLAATLQRTGSKLIQGGAADNHLHLLVDLSPSHSIEETVRRIKGASSHWLHRRWPELSEAGWQHGYAAHSVDYRNLDHVIAYIRDQRRHHAG